MAGLSAPRNTKQWGAIKAVLDDLEIRQKGNTILYQGGIVAESGGYGSPASATLGNLTCGILELNPQTGSSDATGLADGANIVRVRQGVFRVDNSTSTDLIAVADIGHPCFIVDDHTVAKTNSNGTRPFAGIIMDVDSAGVWVFFSLQLSKAQGDAVFGDPAAVTAAGAIPLHRNVVLSVTGTQAQTLANGLFVGQRVAVTVIAGASTPDATITPTTPRGFATVSALGAIGDFVEFIWTSTGWIVGANAGVTVA